MCVGDRVCVTALRSWVLRNWKGNSILAVTDHSEIHTNYTQPPHEDAGADSQQDTPPEVMMSCNDDDTAESDPQRSSFQADVRIKQSRIITYQVTVREC